MPVGFSAEEKIGRAGEGNYEFEKRAAHDHKRVAEAVFAATVENAEERMSDFVDHEIGVIEEEEAGTVLGGVEKKEEIERQSDDGDGAGDGFPFVEGDGGPGHVRRVTRRCNRFERIGERCCSNSCGVSLR